MTYIVDSPKLMKKINIDTENNAIIKKLQKQLVTLSFSQGNHSQEYQNTLKVIEQLRHPSKQ